MTRRSSGRSAAPRANTDRSRSGRSSMRKRPRGTDASGRRRLTGVANWAAVVALYDHLLALTGSPVVILNRAVARGELDGPHAALADLAPLKADKRKRR